MCLSILSFRLLSCFTIIETLSIPLLNIVFLKRNMIFICTSSKMKYVPKLTKPRMFAQVPIKRSGFSNQFLANHELIHTILKTMMWWWVAWHIKQGSIWQELAKVLYGYKIVTFEFGENPKFSMQAEAVGKLTHMILYSHIKIQLCAFSILH